MQVIDAEDGHLPAILSIYNHVVETSTAVYLDHPVDLANRTAWRADRLALGYPVLVAVDGDDTLGFASFGDWRGAWPGYRFTVEHTVMVRDGLRGRGVGRALMTALEGRAQAMGKHAMLGSVDADNAASIRFHESLGYVQTGRFSQVGAKFGRWLDMVFMQKLLDGRESP